MFKRIILDNQERFSGIEVLPREYEFYDDLWKLNKIISFVGPRRVGKTFLMFNFLKKLIIEKKIDLEQIVFIDFSLWSGEKVNPETILSDYYELYKNKQPIFVFDEIQDITNFKDVVLYFYSKNFKVLISGSNSKLLSSELSTHFRGRNFEYKVYPLTFSEILLFKNIKIKDNYSTKEMGLLKQILDDTLVYGNFPEFVLSTDNNFRYDLQKNYFDVLFYKDLLERYSVENEYVLKYFIKSIFKGFTKNLSINKIFTDLKSQNVEVGKNTLYNYFEYLKNIFLVGEISNVYNEKGFKNIYLYNIGLPKVYSFSPDLGQSFENLAYLHLLKKYGKVYFKQKDFEIDFFISDKNINIQIVYELNENNIKRETSILSKQDGEKILVYVEIEDNLKLEEGIKYLLWRDFLLYKF